MRRVVKLIGRYVPPPAGVRSPSLWGTEERLRVLFGERIAALKAERQNFVFRYRTPQHWLDTFRTYYGPMHKALGVVDAAQRQSLAADLIRLVEQFNRATDGAMLVPSEYLEIVIKTSMTKRITNSTARRMALGQFKRLSRRIVPWLTGERVRSK